MKRFVSILLSAVLLLSVFSVFGFAKDTKKYVVIGDSIARGAGVLNPDEACYGIMVANTNGYSYANLGIDGITSKVLLGLLEREDFQNHISSADIISLSIGGNDYLTSNLIKLFIDAEITHKYDDFYKIRDSFYNNFSLIIGKMKTLNPNALILVQTVYNMRHDFLTGVNRIGANLLNECYYRYLDENPGAYVIIDVSSKLTGTWDCLAFDTIHPNGKGNKEIARLILAELKSQGLGTATEPVIKIEPIEQFKLGIVQLYRVVSYYIRYFRAYIPAPLSR